VAVAILTTERLVLREPAPADAAQVLVFRGDPQVQRFNDEPLRDLAQCEAFIEYLRAESAAQRRRHWAITLDDAVVGLIGLHSWSHGHRRAELGYDLARSQWGRGIAAEAGEAVIRHGFATMNLHRIEAHTIADNHRSVRLLRRLGFRLEGRLRDYSLEDDGAYHHSVVFGLLRTDPPGHAMAGGAMAGADV
jgi:RimJ/RimL family protein N-acetyltransferase